MFNDNHWNLKKVVVDLKKVRFKVVVVDLGWSLLTGNRCLEMVVKA